MKIKSVFNVLGKQKTKIYFEFHFPVPLKNSWHYKVASSCGSDTIISGIISTVHCCKLSNDQKNSPFLILQKKKVKKNQNLVSLLALSAISITTKKMVCKTHN